MGVAFYSQLQPARNPSFAPILSRPVGHLFSRHLKFVKLIVCVTLISRFQNNREIISVYVINEVLYTYQNFPDVFQIHLFRCHLMLHSQSPRTCPPRVFPCRQNLDKKRDKSFKIINKTEYPLSLHPSTATHTQQKMVEKS